MTLEEKLKQIKLFVTDFDGVHTDGKVYVDQDRAEMVVCSRKDGLGFNILKKAEIKACIISKESNRVIEARARKLQVPFYQGVDNDEGKLKILKRIIKELGLTSENVLYMGDDINDKACLEFAGVAVGVADCHSSLEELLDYKTTRKGGDHAIREVIELILQVQGRELTF